jgi:tRNA pseudouridine55 synthase
VTSGLLLVDKPIGFTSHDVVAKVRKILGTKKVGHAGTLDPMATGLLVLGIGSATKLLTYLVGLDKTYTATISLGSSTITDDSEGEVLTVAEPDQLARITEESISSGIEKLTGTITQIPSSVSAKKVAGVRAYDLVRAGVAVDLKANDVVVEKFEITSPVRFSEKSIEVDVEVSCSSGTYIRALARDLGADLGVGGHLTALRRIRVGAFSVESAQQIENLDAASAMVISASDAVKQFMKFIQIDELDATKLRNGIPLKQKLDGIAASICGEDLVAIVEPKGENLVKSVVVFPKESDD